MSARPNLSIRIDLGNSACPGSDHQPTRSLPDENPKTAPSWQSPNQPQMNRHRDDRRWVFVCFGRACRPPSNCTMASPAGFFFVEFTAASSLLPAHGALPAIGGAKISGCKTNGKLKGGGIPPAPES